MKTTMTSGRLAATLPAMRRLTIPFLRRTVKTALGLQPARRPAIPLAPITSTTNVEEIAATGAAQEKQQDDGHNLPTGKQRGGVVKERGGESRPRCPPGLAELALKVRSSCFGPSLVSIPTTTKSPPPPDTPPAAVQVPSTRNIGGKRKREKQGRRRSDSGWVHSHEHRRVHSNGR